MVQDMPGHYHKHGLFDHTVSHGGNPAFRTALVAGKNRGMGGSSLTGHHGDTMALAGR